MRIISSLILAGLLLTQNAIAQIYYPGQWNGNQGMGGFPLAGGSYNFQTAGGDTTVPVFDNGLAPSSVQYRNVKVNSSCPLLTSTVKDDTDIFTDLKNFLSTASKNPKCSLSNDSSTGFAQPSDQPSVSTLESMLNGESRASSGMMGGGDMNGQSVKCYTKNVELIGQRNLAYYYSEKKMVQGKTTAYTECLNMKDELTMKAAPLEEIRNCISETYESQVEENKHICREMSAPQNIQKQINKGLVGIEQILNQALSNREECGFKTQDLFKVTMNTFLKTKALSVVGPWGAVAGFGADLVGNLLDKIFPSDAQKATAMMDEILSEETFEQNACLYYNVQQKMYCEDRPVEIATPNPGCQTISVTSDLLQLIQKYKDIKKITDSYSAAAVASPVTYGGQPGITNPAVFGGMPLAPKPLSPEMESELIEHLDELAKYTISNEEDLRERVKALPKMQQSREQLKIDNLIKMMNAYQSYDPQKDVSGQEGKKLIEEIAKMFMSKDTDSQLDLSTFVVKTTPGTKLENIKQRSIARTIEQLMAKEADTQSLNESSRVMARYNKYKTAMGVLAKGKFEARLEKQFKEFENQVKFVSSRDQGIVDDSVAEGQLRNLVRHCSLLQEVYDPSLEGKMPRACEKLSCNSNKMEWFSPQKDQQNFKEFKQQYCDKSLGYQKVESDFVKELKSSTGAKICGVKAESFF